MQTETTTSIDISIQKTNNSRLSEVDFDNLVFGRLMTDHMFCADYIDGKWTNAQILPYQDLPLSPALSSIHYGQSIFEGLKAYKNPDTNEVMVFRPDQNFQRINISAMRMSMPQIPEDLWNEAMNTLLDMDRDWIPTSEGASLYIRPFMFATDAFLGMRASETYKFMIICSPVGKYYGKPVKVRIETNYTRASEGGVGYAKAAGNYAASMYPTRLAQRKGYDQVIWTDGKSHEHLEEAGTMNVMFVIQDTLITPSTEDTILAGINRKSILQIAKEWGVRVEERKISIREMVHAFDRKTMQEAFGAGTAATVAPISHIGYGGVDYELPPITENSLANRLLKEMEDIKRGRKADTRGWVHKI
jgi:branched-chain amino acid aminotransferase